MQGHAALLCHSPLYSRILLTLLSRTMKSQYQAIRNKKRLAIFLIKLSVRGEIVKTNLRKILEDIYLETGELFVKTEFGVVFESFLIVDSDSVCNPLDKLNGCGDGYDVKTGICSSNYHKPIAPVLIPSHADERQLPIEADIFPGNLYTVCGILPTIKPLPGLKKRILVNFRRDFGDTSMRKHWPSNISFSRYNVKNITNNKVYDGICDVIK